MSESLIVDEVTRLRTALKILAQKTEDVANAMEEAIGPQRAAQDLRLAAQEAKAVLRA